MHKKLPMQAFPLSKALRAGAIAAGLLCVTMTAWPAATDIFNEPLATPVTNAKPNLMFILDDSGSMGSNYSPDYVNDSGCFDSKNSNNDINGTSLSNCAIGDPPYMSAQYNRQYYNPNISYRPALNYDGTERNNMNSANTTGWTIVPADHYGKESTSNTNLLTGFPDKVWCKNSADTASDTTNCKRNSAYTYPNDEFGYGKTLNGNPYYYTIAAGEYCTDANMSDCVAAPGDATHTVPSAVRFCTTTNPNTATDPPVAADYGNCYAKRVTIGSNNYQYPRFVGKVSPAPGAVTPAVAATGTITVGNSGSDTSVNITGIKINGVDVISSTITAATGTNASGERDTVAAAINTQINAKSAASGFTSTVAGSVVTITASTAGAAVNGQAIVVTSPNVGTGAKASVTITKVGNKSSSTISVTVNSVVITGNAAVGDLGKVVCNFSSDTATNRATCANSVKTAINNNTATNGGFTATIDAVTNTKVIIQATTAISNTVTLATNSNVNATSTNFTGGSNVLIPTTNVNMAGGSDSVTATSPVRRQVFNFTRVDIVPGTTSYPKGSGRSDCLGSTCTYAEEMTNFANWWTYYRTRMQMMKTSAGRAFGPIDDQFRVGFITINPGTLSATSSKYLKINDYTDGSSGHKKLWYDMFYAQDTNNSTPLREALSRVGQLYAGKLGTSATTLTSGIPAADDPVQYSCQANFTILSTDGYWNGGSGRDLSNATMGNTDGDPADAYSIGYTTAQATPAAAAIGVYEGATSSNTLADVAQYYYKTDLRSSMANNVRSRGDDDAPHQHMTTFTIGLGLDGFLTFDQDYVNKNKTTGDFYDIKRGAKVWPVPAADTPSALDDLWHAAVNGRGTFYSAADPQQLINGLVDALTTLQTALGAGAAAATSNLRPVAGDNFAFAGEYTTVEWSGDIKAYTLDLGTGIVSKNPLWSARSQLDTRTFSSRQIYTLDATDTGGNKLKHFCAAGAAGCSDGGGLTTTELANFSPSLLTQYSLWSAAQKAAATSGTVVDYLRGDVSKETTGGSATTDLFRNRTSVMGDIVGSKPAYLKGATFNYADTGYSAFIACTNGTGTGCPAAQFPTPTVRRSPTVFVGANDGMMHAFETDVNNSPYYQTAGITTDPFGDDVFNAGNNAGNGNERWAYVPTLVFPNMSQLANDSFTHNFLVDGSPIIGDICTTVSAGNCSGLDYWRTIMVSSLRAGGRGFFALDITDPANPKGLWEFGVSSTCASAADIAAGTVFSDCHVGLSYADPIITKRKSDGKWVVIVSSGYNNFNPGDGKGYLYVLEATTGKVLSRISTGVGTQGTGPGYSDTDPSGLGKISAWADSPLTDNTTLAVYGGDLKGNMWRFDLDSASAGYLTATKIFTAKASNNAIQQITTKPELALVQNKRVVSFATGKFIGISDKASTSGNTVYAVEDSLTAASYTRSDLAQRTLVTSAAGTTRSVATSSSTVLWSGSNHGWFADFPSTAGATSTIPSERVFVDPILQAGSLVVASTTPDSTDGCTAGGFSWLNTFDISTGLIPVGVASGVTAGQRVTGVIVGFSLIQLPDGSVKTEVRLGTGESITRDTPVSSGSFGGRRVTWRELTGVQQ